MNTTLILLLLFIIIITPVGSQTYSYAKQ